MSYKERYYKWFSVLLAKLAPLENPPTAHVQPASGIGQALPRLLTEEASCSFVIVWDRAWKLQYVPKYNRWKRQTSLQDIPSGAKAVRVFRIHSQSNIVETF